MKRPRLYELAFLCTFFQSLSAALETSVDIKSAQEAEQFNSIVERYEAEIKKRPHDLKLLLAVADVYYALKEWTKAIKYYQRALELDPRNPKIETSLALAYLNNNEIDASTNLLQEVILQDPSNPDALAGLGRIDALKHRYLEAELLLQKVLLKNPNHFTALFYLAELKIDQKQFAEAQEMLNKLLKINPSATWVQQALKRAELGPLFEKAAELKENGENQEAIDLLKEQLNKTPDLELYLALANLYTESKKYPEAITLLNEGIKAFPKENALNLNLGFTYLANNELMHAHYIFTNILKGKTGHAEALAGLGRIAALRGRPQQADKLYEEAYQLNPLSTLTLSYMGKLRMEQGKYKEAQELFEKVYQLDPRSTWAKQAAEEAQVAPFFATITAEEKQGNFEKTEQLYEDILNRFPEMPENYLRFARYYRDQKNYQKSIETLQRGLKASPEAISLYIALGHDYLLAGKYEQSQEVLEKALLRQPNNPEALAEQGRLYAARGEIKEALKYYHRALSLNPRDLTALSYSIDLQMELKNYLAAEKLLKRVLKINPHASWAEQMLLKARFGPQFDEIHLLEKEGNQGAAQVKLEKLLQLAPLSQDVYLELGQIYSSLKKYKEAADLYRQGLELEPGATQLRIDLGLTYLKLKDWKRAQLQLEKAYRADPKNGDALAGLGKLYELKGDKDQALIFYQKATTLNPTNLLALSSLADFWLAQKQFDKAKEIYQKILKIDPQATWAKNNALEASYGPLIDEASEKEKSKDYIGAEDVYRQLLVAEPDQPTFYVKLGNLYLKAKQYKEAESTYYKGLAILPESVDLNNGLGFLYLAENKENEAKQIFQKVLKISPNNAEALAGIGRFYETSGHVDQAIEQYQKALRYDPNNMTALVYLSGAMLEKGKYTEAQKLYKRIYALEPQNNAWARLAIKDAKHGRLLAEIKAKTKAKDYKAVEQLWRQLLKEEPTTTAYYLRYGLFLQYIKAYDKAIDVFLEGIKIDPHSSELEAGLGLAYLSKKDLPNAHKAFKKALVLDPKNPDALAGLGYVALLKDNDALAEQHIKAALLIDPERIAALSSYGDLLLKEKKYSEAEAVYRKIVEMRPEENVFKLSLEDAIYGNQLDEIHELIKNDQFAEAADRYSQLLLKSPDNVNFIYGLGQMYMRLRQYGKSIEVNLQGLKKYPENNALRIALGYDYFFNKHLDEAREALNQALELDEKDPEALAGLGRVEEFEENYDEAEDLYIRALKEDPKNLSALGFYGNFLMRHKRYTEAQALFSRLSEILPDAVWAQQALQDARDGPVTNIANRLNNREEFELAADIYRDLVYASPEDPARYLALGQTYANLQEYCWALETYFTGLEIDPEAGYLWRAVGFTYILQEEFDAAEEIFETLLEEDSEDTESWAGLGRIQALNGSYCLAGEYYGRALEIDRKNLTTLSFLSELYQNEEWNFSSFATNYVIGEVIESDLAYAGESWPKWAIRSYNNSLNLSCPVLYLGGSYHEEDQWDPTLHRWSAKYQVYGGKALLKYPLWDGLTIWGSCADQFFALNDEITRKYLYFFDVQRIHVGARWVYNSCFYVDAALGISDYSPYRKSTFKMKTDTITEPSVILTYHTPTSKATLSFTTNSDLVARNFNENRAKIVGYYTLGGTYEQKVMQRGWVGFDVDLITYNDYVDNNSQRVSGWFQWRPPCYSENFVFRYYSKYQTFAKNIPDYYTYKPQFINQLQATCEKSWRVCWADTFYTSLSYTHGWQNTRTRFRQIIVVTPVPVQQPFSWDDRVFNTVVGTMIFKRGPLQLTLTADYYRDSEKYTMWTVAGEMGWRF